MRKKPTCQNNNKKELRVSSSDRLKTSIITRRRQLLEARNLMRGSLKRS